MRAALDRSRRALAAGEHQYFARALKMREAWRAFPEFRHSCVYLDIETDGADITMVGLYDGHTYQSLVRGDDLGNVVDALSRYSLIVTFAGSMFDIPQLQREFRSLLVDQIHIDLCTTLRELNIRGGLKKIEKVAGIQRPPEIDGLNGYDAVRLWRRWMHLHDESSLQRLIAYNRADVENLEHLMLWAYPQLCHAAENGFAHEASDEDSA